MCRVAQSVSPEELEWALAKEPPSATIAAVRKTVLTSIVEVALLFN